MTQLLALVSGAALGTTVAWLLVPLTRRELAAAMARASAAVVPAPATVPSPAATVAAPAGGGGRGQADGPARERADEDRVTASQRAVLVIVSGALPAYVLGRVGWAAVALPPLLLLVGLVQLAYCDLTRRLLPKALVYLLTAAVVACGVVVAGFGHEWVRLVVATVGGLACFALFFVVNLVNPDWLAFGDVRLALVVGFGLAWVSPVALLEGFLVANLLAAVTGFALMTLRRAGRRSAVPFGLYLAAGTALVLLTWS